MVLGSTIYVHMHAHSRTLRQYAERYTQTYAHKRTHIHQGFMVKWCCIFPIFSDGGKRALHDPVHGADLPVAVLCKLDDVYSVQGWVC